MSSQLISLQTKPLSSTAPASVSQEPTSKDHQINVFELTLLLKVMGFRLNHLDYEPTPTGAQASSTDITIEIRCGKQNIVSRLSANEDSCSCPAKREETENEASFWEILGTAPSNSPGGKKRIQDTSSNLLPELSQRGVSNTRQLLKLIYDGFHKDHLPSTTTTTSPEQRPLVPPNPIHTSTQIKSPRRLVPVLNADMLLHDEDAFHAKVSPSVLTAPPNTPKVSAAGGFGKAGSMPNFRHQDHLVYLEVMAAKERLEKALLAMKVNIAGELNDLHGPPLDLSANKIFEEVETAAETGVSPATFKRRSSMGSFPNIKSRIDTGDGKKKTTLVRNKSSIDAGAALKAKTGAVTSRYLQPKKPVEVKKTSPLARRTPLSASAKLIGPKRTPAAGAGWK